MQMFDEIGSEFWDVPTQKNTNKYFDKSVQWFLSGRSALQAIIKEIKGCRTVAMPSWCCDSMIKPFADAGIKIHFYSVYFDSKLVQEINLECDALFLMDYFGYTGSQPDLTGYKGVVIRDVTHSLFSFNHRDADYYFGSLRKWCGVWTGGYAWTRDGHKLSAADTDISEYISLREKAMAQKRSYVSSRGAAEKDYLAIYAAAEDMLENADHARAASRDVLLSSKLDVDGIKAQRRSNATILRNAFENWVIFADMKEHDCPMFVPILVPHGKRDSLKRHLIQQRIYCPIHWPLSEFHNVSEPTKRIYRDELSLVCDQRYTDKDMHRIVKSIKAFWKEI